MRIALSSYDALGAWFGLRLRAEGHEVDYYLSNSKYEDILRGLIPPPKMLSVDHRRHLMGYGYPSYEKYDLSLFEQTGKPRQAEFSKGLCPTLGDGAFETELEDNRRFGIEVMEQCGIRVPEYKEFSKPSEAKAFIAKTKKRYVYKPYENPNVTDKAITYVSKNSDDLIAYIDLLFQKSGNAPFILQEFVEGIEIGVEAFFNGTEFFLLTGTFEEKKFMNDNKGPNTGCSGNLIVALSDDVPIFKEGLLKAKSFLDAVGFRGIIDLNTIVTEDSVYGLEWTPRFGYHCCPTIATMYGLGYGDLLRDIATGKNPEIKWGSGNFGAATMLSIPPYPTDINLPKAKGIAIEGLDPKNLEELCETYLYDVCVDKNSLVTAGHGGGIGAVLSAGHSIDAAFAINEGRLKKLQIPDVQYRTDLKKTTTKRYEQLQQWGWL